MAASGEQLKRMTEVVAQIKDKTDTSQIEALIQL